eukprot:GHVQ01020212.1.p1 GENE.GHVQ01020212.1~~GHVQ01020212.1.p1  ORF type:complete len:120 (-),score=12.02 GHVQ01020212.1:85-444(-)
MEGNDSNSCNFCEKTNTPTDACNAQWLMLWTAAAYAPDKPSDTEQRHLRVFFEHFPDQCTQKSYSQAVHKFPPRASTRRDLMLWLCFVENFCRTSAGLSVRQCSYKDLYRRWRYSDGYL